MNNTQIITDVISISFTKFNESTLDIDAREITEHTYLSESDGTKVSEFSQAFSDITDKDFEWESNNRDEAWINHWNDEVIEQFNGRTYEVKRTQEWKCDQEGELLDLVGESFEIHAAQ